MAATTSATAVNASALRRLQRDFAQLQREPIANIVAEPLDGNLFNWAVNMVATEGTQQRKAARQWKPHSTALAMLTTTQSEAVMRCSYSRLSSQARNLLLCASQVHGRAWLCTCT